VISYRKKLGTRFEEKEQELDAVIKEAICEFPNYTLMIESLLDLKTESAEKLKEWCFMRVGVPLKPMLAKPTKGVQVVLARFEGVPFTCEYKYDGFRGQVHFDKETGLVRIYSRNLENMT
jgi:DNA ligase-1